MRFPPFHILAGCYRVNFDPELFHKGEYGGPRASGRDRDFRAVFPEQLYELQVALDTRCPVSPVHRQLGFSTVHRFHVDPDPGNVGKIFDLFPPRHTGLAEKLFFVYRDIGLDAGLRISLIMKLHGVHEHTVKIKYIPVLHIRSLCKRQILFPILSGPPAV